MTDGPVFRLRELCRTGEIEADPVQALGAEKLQSLHHALRHYEPGGEDGWKARFGIARRRQEAPQGLYIYGDVGRGKSMLMDLFFESVDVGHKRRVHFHAFMLEIHERLHAWRQDERAGQTAVDDALRTVADQVAADAWLLCFDEFHVANIADAMILGRLFEALFERGVVIVATSNWPPEDLYKDGLQRELFLPFIALIKEKLDLLALAGPKDYRRARLFGTRVYHVPLGLPANQALAEAFDRLTAGAQPGPESVTVKGRVIAVPQAARRVACFGFDELCGEALGAGDYLALAERYRALILSNIPRMNAERRDEAKRFATLIDVLYEKRRMLICSAEAAPQELYTEGTGAFDFQRTVSRLMEMQSAEYLAEQ